MPKCVESEICFGLFVAATFVKIQELLQWDGV